MSSLLLFRIPWCIVLFACAQVYVASAYEVDNFTDRAKLKTTPDATATINADVNKRILAAIVVHNSKNKKSENKGCDFNLIANLTRDVMGGGFSVFSALKNGSFATGVEEQFESADELKKYRIPVRDENIYVRKRKWWQRVSQGTMLELAGVQPSLNIGGKMVGVDKLGHFFSEGLSYFRLSVRKDAKIRDVLNFGVGMEEGGLGLDATGVKSYGDLSANYAGFRFWQRFLSNPSEYLRCDGKKFTYIQPFRIETYAHPGWDEGVNCSEFIESISDAVKLNIKEVPSRCPQSASACRKLLEIECSEGFASPACKKIDRRAPASRPACELKRNSVLGVPKPPEPLAGSGASSTSSPHTAGAVSK